MNILHTDNDYYFRLWLTNNRPDPSSEWAPHMDRTVTFNQNKYLVMSPRRGSIPKQTDWLTVSRKVTLTLTLWPAYTYELFSHICSRDHQSFPCFWQDNYINASNRFQLSLCNWWAVAGGHLSWNVYWQGVTTAADTHLCSLPAR
jgi:hypothetical protein